MEHSKITSKEQKPGLWENIFVIFSLFFSTGALIPLLEKNNGKVFNPIQGDITLQVLWFAVFGITFFLLFSHRHQVYCKAFKEKLLWVLVGMALLSVFWSAAPLVTLRRSAALLGTTMFGLYLATRYTKEELIKLLAWSFGVITLLSLVFVMFLPSYGLQHYGNVVVWQGIYINKNGLGCMMTLSAITWLLFSLISTTRTKCMVGFCFCAISLLLLYYSNSTTSMAIFFMLFILLLLFLVYRHFIQRPGPLLLIFVIISLGCLAIILFRNIDILLAIVGKDATFSGRTELWHVVWQMIQQRPWLGYGYNAFWLEWNGPSREIWRILTWNPPHAHNGYLDLWLQIGFVGLVLFVLSFAINYYRAITNVLRNKSFAGIFALFFLTFLLIHNIMESNILMQNSIFWILYTVITIQLHNSSGGQYYENSKFSNTDGGWRSSAGSYISKFYASRKRL